MLSTTKSIFHTELKGKVQHSAWIKPKTQAVWNTNWSWGAGIACFFRVPDSWSKGCEFVEQWENFLLQSQLCAMSLMQCLFHPPVTAVACKRPWSFCQKCRWQVTPKHAYTLTKQGRSGLTMLLSRHSVGTYEETSSHVIRQETLGHSRLSSLSKGGLILA